MIKVAICDDDKNIVNDIKRYIESYNGASFEISLFNSGEDLIENKDKFNVIFLDIDMDGIDGIKAAKKIREYDKAVKIIYVTSYTDYLNIAFSVHAFGYLNKPISEEQIHSQISEAISYFKEEEVQEKLEFVTTDGIVRLAPKEIYYFEYIDRKVVIKTKDYSYSLKGRITAIAKDMAKYDFVMPHQSFTVNLFHVKSIKGYDIFMMDGSLIPLSQKKSTEFRDKFNMYLEKRILS
ncbi:response regulator [Clostridium tertium]|uniref:Stage 0 sporulation protein A homolog n=1 Tax=Clostridium tertium TaxID=1559 RepID=A0A6N3GL52_9CLOT